MKKLLIAGIFSLLALAPLTVTLAQSAGNNADAQAVEKSSAAIPAANATAKNHTTSSTATDSTAGNSEADPKTALEAQKSYDTGLGLYNSGKLAEAIDAFKESNKLKPNDPQTQYMLGMAYWKNKGYVQAVDSFKHAVKNKPEWDEPYFRLGLTYYVLGRTSQTNETYKKLLELNPTLAAKLAKIVGEPDVPAASETAKATAKPATVKPTVPVSSATVPANIEPSAPLGDVNSASLKTTAARIEPTNDKSAASTAAAPASNNASAATVSPEPTTASAPVKAIAEDSPLTDIYRVGAGDVLDIRLLNSAGNQSTLYSVIDGGLLDFPLAGAPIQVAGLTTQEIQARITSALKRLAVAEQSQVAVGVRQYGSHTVIVTGLAGSPGT
ncbi:MAG TPA: polysaccharide biosynthesis/export family protein, partial [Pyrinomonadaceae bacterium]|nr:polysaccharide biosynthesis/export family protein [Pyrinomonadaceae bacterium]